MSSKLNSNPHKAVHWRNLFEGYLFELKTFLHIDNEEPQKVPCGASTSKSVRMTSCFMNELTQYVCRDRVTGDWSVSVNVK